MKTIQAIKNNPNYFCRLFNSDPPPPPHRKIPGEYVWESHWSGGCRSVRLIGGRGRCRNS